MCSLERPLYSRRNCFLWFDPGPCELNQLTSLFVCVNARFVFQLEGFLKVVVDTFAELCLVISLALGHLAEIFRDLLKMFHAAIEEENNIRTRSSTAQIWE